MRAFLNPLTPLFTAACLVLAVAQARAETLVTSLSSHQVQISSNYTGSQVVVFGAVQRDAQTIARASGYDAVIAVRGPRQQVLTVREKERLGPIWINRTQTKFAEIPSYYALLTSRPLGELTAEIMRGRLRLGADMVFEPETGAEPALPGDARFREALVRLRTRAGLYLQVDRGVTFINPTIFRAAIPLSAEAPTGNYEVEVFLFADGVPIARDRTNFELVKTGFEQQITTLAETNSFAYGAATAFMALLFGWLATVVFRRD
ncbi:MAG: TIGR02186 family protein [Microvirga sp.]|nr:TIGR02186 family protein [Microvirga sp.]